MRHYNSKDIKIKKLIQKYKRAYYNFKTKIWTNVGFRRKTESAKLPYIELLKCKTYLDFEKIIGNKGWTRPTCEECNKESINGVYFNESNNPLYFERKNIFICKNCIMKANRLI